MSDDSKISCFSWEGRKYGNNTKCPGSHSCCQTVDKCRPDRLCDANEEDEEGVAIRALCDRSPWRLDTCAQICLYDNEDNYLLPRVNICPDGSYCCDNEPTCCIDKQGFFLHQNGTLKGRANETSTTSTTTSSETSTSTTQSSFPSSLTTGTLARETESSGGLSSNAKIGMGVGIPVGVLLLVGIAALTWFIRRKKKQEPPKGNKVEYPDQVPFPVEYYGGSKGSPPMANESPNMPPKPPVELPHNQRAPSELDASVNSSPVVARQE